MKFTLERTKKGFPAIWESGGSCTNTGTACIIADKNGAPKKAVYVRRKGSLANSDHALIIVERGDHIIIADHHREDFTICIYKVLSIRSKLKKDYYYDYLYNIDNQGFIKKFGKDYETIKKETTLTEYSGYYVINEKLRARKWCNDCIEVYEVKEKITEQTIAIADKLCTFDWNEWDKTPPAKLNRAIEAAKEKALCYHCRGPHFIKEE